MEASGKWKVRDLIMQGQVTIEIRGECFPDRSDFALRSKRNTILQELSTQPWSVQEDLTILQFVSERQVRALSTIFLVVGQAFNGQLTSHPADHVSPPPNSRK
jgi:hypothetical protein